MAEALVALDATGQTDIGLKRQKNEDSYNLQIPTAGSPQYAYGALFVVADGMGGMGGGDVASQTAIKEIFQRYYAPETSDTDPFVSLKEALETANVAVREQAKQLNRVRIGSTAAGLVLLPSNEALLFNVGDSRVYRIRQSYIEQLTHDQSVLQGQIDGGLISEEDARVARNVNVTAFIGQPTPLQPVFRRAQAQIGDIFVICSDGLWDLVEPHEILSIVQSVPAEAAGRKLIALARQRGGPDNITVIIVRLGPKPAQRRVLIWAAAALAAAALLLAGAGLVYGLTRDDGTATAQSPPPTTSQAVAALPGETETVSAVETDTQAIVSVGPSATRGPEIEVFTSTPSITPTITRTPEPSDTPKPTDTSTPRPTATDTRTPRPTHTPTPGPTDTPTITPTRTPRPTDTPPPTDTPRPTNTPKPTATATPVIPTVTLNPFVVSLTPTLTPTTTPTLSPQQQMLAWANLEGVVLTQQGYLYEFDSAKPPAIVRESLVLAGTQVKLLSEIELPHPITGEILREVGVISGREQVAEGWMPETLLEQAVPITPRVTTKDMGDVNLRSGDSMVFRVVDSLHPGEYAIVLGISNRNRDWYKIKLPDGTEGWVSSGVVITIGDVSKLPALVPPPLPARPTMPPAVTATTAPPAFTPSGDGGGEVPSGGGGEPPVQVTVDSGGGGGGTDNLPTPKPPPTATP